MRARIRVMNTGAGDARFNMAADEAILVSVIEGSSPATLRFYSFSPPAVTLGRFQEVKDDLRVRAESMGLLLVRRPTGGRAVAHDGDLTFSITARIDDEVLGGSTTETYREISKKLARALLEIGADVTSGQPGGRDYRSSASCFDTRLPHELRLGGEKVSASAQMRRSGAFLVQGTIPLRRSSVDFSLLFGASSRAPQGLSSLVGREVGADELMVSIVESFGCAAGFSGFTEREEKLRDRLIPKYGSDVWNYLSETPELTRVYAGSAPPIMY